MGSHEIICEKDRNDEAALDSALPFLGRAGHLPSLLP